MLSSLPSDIVVLLIESTDSPIDTACVLTRTCSSLALIGTRWLATVQHIPSLLLVLPPWLSSTSRDAHLRTRLRLLSSLTTVDICGCDCAAKVDERLLEMVHTSKVQTLRLTECEHLTDVCALLRRTSSSLTSLSLVACPNLTFDFSTSCPNLTHLDVSGCRGVSDVSTFALPQIQSVVTRNCFNLTDLSVVIRRDIAPNLTRVDASACPLVKVDVLEWCKSLTYLDVSRCHDLTDTHLAMLRHCPLMTHLDVSRCYQLTDVGIASVVERCTRLEHLDVSHCIYVTNSGVGAVLDQCPHLASLATNSCKNVSVHHALDWPRHRLGPDHVWRTLTHLNVDAIAFDADMYAIANVCPGLTSISLARCYNLSDRGIVLTLQTVPSLTHLDVTYCGEVTDASLVAMSYCPRLISVHFASCYRVTDSGVEALASHCRYLEHVQMGGCPRVGDRGVVALAEHCPRLQYLDAGFCSSVSDVGVVTLARKCVHLRHLDVQYCRFLTGVGIAAIVSKASALSYLNVYGCTLVKDVGVAHSESDLMSKLSFVNMNKCFDVVNVRVLLRASPMVRFLYLRDCKHVSDADVRTIAQCCPLLQKLDLYGCSAVTDLAPIVHQCIHLQMLYMPAKLRVAVRELAESLGRHYECSGPAF